MLVLNLPEGVSVRAVDLYDLKFHGLSPGWAFAWLSLEPLGAPVAYSFRSGDGRVGTGIATSRSPATFLVPIGAMMRIGESAFHVHSDRAWLKLAIDAPREIEFVRSNAKLTGC